MGDEEDISSLTGLVDLIKNYPDLDMTLVADVLQECNQDCSKAFEMLCEMVIPPDAVEHDEDTTDIETQPERRGPKLVAAPETVRYAYAGGSDDGRPEYDSIFQSSPTATSTPELSPVSESLPRPAPTPTLQGAWAQKSMGRKYRVDEICRRYEWISRSVVEDLCNKYHDCVELVETDILHMFPVDEPEAFGGGRDPRESPNGDSSTGRLSNARNDLRNSSNPSSHQSRRKAIAESLRQQAAEEIHRDSLSAESISLSSKGMTSLRSELWETRETRMRLQQLANHTRKATHIASAKEKDAELRRLSAFFLDRMRRSEEYKNGIIDLHGLTKEESLQLVEWKLQDSGRRRFKAITGKGIHSHNGQAVLRPALEKYFRSNGISFSMCADGVMSIVP